MKIWIVEYWAIEEHENIAVCTSLETAKSIMDYYVPRQYEMYGICEYETDEVAEQYPEPVAFRNGA